MLKRLFDFLLAAVLVIILLPLWLILWLLVRVNLGKPVLFKQLRPGKNEEIFTIYKFRTMTDQKNSDGQLLPDKQRLTRFGKFLRSTSLDELPQLFNILKGDMSFVGPRALLIEYLPLYNKKQKKRHAVKPGITGWAQSNGRNAIEWNQKFELDLWYIKHQSFWLDLKIMWITFLKVLKRHDINQSGKPTTDYFTGNNNGK